MSMDTMEQGSALERLSDEERRKLVSELQIRVAREMCAPKDSPECAAPSGDRDNEIMFKWVDSSDGPSLSARFREIIDAHPELVERYADKSDLHEYDQDAVVARIEGLLNQR